MIPPSVKQSRYSEFHDRIRDDHYLVRKRLVDCEMHEKKDREDAEEEKRKGEAEANEANEKQQQGIWQRRGRRLGWGIRSTTRFQTACPSSSNRRRLNAERPTLTGGWRGVFRGAAGPGGQRAGPRAHAQQLGQ
jgi:hypothetical protein